MSDVDLIGKVAIVTGAAQGMGREIAQTLSSAGAKVVFTDIDGDKVNQLAIDANTLGVKADVTNEDDVNNLVQTTLSHFNTVDILVNNAGILYPTRISDITKQEWDRVLDVNLNGTFLCTKAVLQTMKQQQFGRIINMSSSAGRSVSTLGGAHYTAAKAAVIGFTRAVAKEVASSGITANAICPGLIDTEMVQAECSPEQVKAYEESFPISRLGTPKEVAETVIFLITGASYITGAAIDINGGDLMM